MTNFGYCKVALMPIRSTSSDPSEMISQLIFGEFVEKIADTEKPNWIKIKCLHDGYEGYVDPKQVSFFDQNTFEIFKKRTPQLTSKVFTPLYFNNRIIKAPQGSDLRCLGGKKGPELSKDLDFALSYIGAPYLWGGRSPFGIDCSGLTQVVFAHKKIQLPRDASEQVKLGDEIEFGKQLFWDLVFFKNDSGKIIHVGILMKENDVLHAHGEVKISKLTEEGLLSDDNKSITHTFHCIKRIYQNTF